MSPTKRLMLNSILLYWRSRQGFMFMLSLVRLIIVAAITLRFLTQENINIIKYSWLGLPYALVAIIMILLVYLHPNYAKLDNPLFYGSIVLFDTITVEEFLFRSRNHESEIYLLLLLPLILTSHYFSRKQGVFVSGAIIVSYAVTLILMKNITSYEALLLANIHFIWLSRSSFLLCATWIYRIQANFPHANETRVVSPEKARTQLEEMLIEFRQSVHYDTVSVQILYRNRLQIVACHGFPNKKEIYQIEFPANDPKYPNYHVVKTHQRQILDPNKFPSFKEPRYHADHIQTWLGVPLIVPSTGECFGLLSVDSAQVNSYNQWDSVKASWFAMKISAFLTEVILGPAALTQATKRENLLIMLKNWAELFRPKSTSNWEDSLEAAHELARFGTRIFDVEDCSIYFLKHKFNEDNEKIRVLHLVASSAIPPEIFGWNESQVTGHHKDGLTGLAVHRNRTINYGAEQIENSPYRSSFVAHLPHLFSKRSRQIMIVPLRDSLGKTTGAIKLENRLGWPSEKPFFPVEQHSFNIFATMVGLLLENIRLRNFANRQSQHVHNLRSIIHTYALSPIDKIILGTESDGDKTQGQDMGILRSVRNAINFTKIGLDSILSETPENPVLEKEGLVPAIREFVGTLKTMMLLNDAAERVVFDMQETREDLPIRIRVGFYNIARESILNMTRHSGIEKQRDGFCKVSFYKSEEVYHLLIEDNGVGFSPESKLSQGHSFGLRDMYFQKEAIRKQCTNADIQIESSHNNGTRIHIWADLQMDHIRQR